MVEEFSASRQQAVPSRRELAELRSISRCSDDSVHTGHYLFRHHCPGSSRYVLDRRRRRESADDAATERTGLAVATGAAEFAVPLAIPNRAHRGGCGARGAVILRTIHAVAENRLWRLVCDRRFMARVFRPDVFLDRASGSSARLDDGLLG